MEEIKFGDYIRTNYKIRRVTNSNFYMQQYVECGEDLVWKNDIVKHSPNIIDLIEVGDYVNGERVEMIQNKCIYGRYCEDGGGYDFFVGADEIKSIVTKEQFANMEYRLEG